MSRRTPGFNLVGTHAELPATALHPRHRSRDNRRKRHTGLRAGHTHPPSKVPIRETRSVPRVPSPVTRNRAVSLALALARGCASCRFWLGVQPSPRGTRPGHKRRNTPTAGGYCCCCCCILSFVVVVVASVACACGRPPAAAELGKRSVPAGCRSAIRRGGMDA